jgi:UrcA family protein
MSTIKTSSPLRSLIAAAIFSALAPGFAAVSAAADSTDAPQVVVKYGDLNVSNPQGAAALYARIRKAAESVCPRFERSDLGSMVRIDNCVHKAIADAVTMVNQPALFAQYNARNGSPLPAAPTSSTIASR